MLSKLYQKNVKISNPFCSIVDKKTQIIQKKTKADYAIHFNDVATLLAVLLLPQLSLQIKNKQKKLRACRSLKAYLARQYVLLSWQHKLSFTTTVISYSRFSRSAEVVRSLADRDAISFLCTGMKN